jgi:hypothetical protein
MSRKLPPGTSRNDPQPFEDDGVKKRREEQLKKEAEQRKNPKTGGK